jgi:hypothetical protein
VRQQLLDAIYAGQPFRSVLRDLGLTPNQVWGLTTTDPQWSAELEAAVTATRRCDLKHGTTPRMWLAVSARTVGNISADEWPRTAAERLHW